MDRTPSKRRPPGPLRDLSPDLALAQAALAIELRAGRDKANMGLQELASQVYWSKATVSRWLNGQAMPTEKQARQWAETCGTDVPTMARLWQQAQEVQEPVAAAAPGPSRRRVRLWPILVGVAVVVGAAVLWFSRDDRPPCALDHPISLHVPPQSGERMSVTAEIRCALPADRRYFVVEEVPNVDVRNPHPAFYVKAQVSEVRIGASSVLSMILKEPVTTRAKFYVISVDEAGERALEENRVIDNGLLDLPEGSRQESAVGWHVKAWE